MHMIPILMLAAPLLWGDLQPGRYDIGFRVIYATDTSRSWSGGAGRPIRISIWYPAQHDGKSQAMHYGDYFHFDGPPELATLNDALEKSDRESYLADFNEVSANGPELLAKLTDTRVAAHKNARPARGRFPLVLYSGGLGSRSDSNVELGEYLASHGYIVATVPQLGPSPEAETDLGGSPAEIDLHARDLEFAWKTLRTLPEVDAKHLAAMGHSIGGIVALVLASRLPHVRAAIGLDGSYGFTGGDKRVGRVRGYDPLRIAAPLLDLRRANGVQQADVDLRAVDALRHSDRYLVTFQRMFHGDFTEFGTIGLRIGIPLPPNNDGRTRLTGYEGNQHTYRAVLDFLDAKVKGKTKAMRRLLSEIADIRHATIVHRAAS